MFQLITNSKSNKNDRVPYIAAKFPQRNIPYTFHLGSGDTYDGFVNRKLDRTIRYRIFVRAIVDTPYKVRIVFEVFSKESKRKFVVCILNVSGVFINFF